MSLCSEVPSRSPGAWRTELDLNCKNQSRLAVLSSVSVSQIHVEFLGDAVDSPCQLHAPRLGCASELLGDFFPCQMLAAKVGKLAFFGGHGPPQALQHFAGRQLLVRGQMLVGEVGQGVRRTRGRIAALIAAQGGPAGSAMG